MAKGEDAAAALEGVQVQAPVEATDSLKGLTSAEVERSRQEHGANEVKADVEPEWKKILKRYTDWIVLLMFAAAIVSVAVPNQGDRGYASFGLLIFELNLVVWVGWYSDRNAGNAIKELEALSAPTSLARRDGSWAPVPVHELVVGDLIQLKGGDVIPADARMLGNGEPLKVDQAALTGESVAVSKKGGDTILSGAVVQQGEGEAVVTAVGANTFFGKTITLLSHEQERGHLQKVLGAVQIAVGVIAALVVVAILAVLLARGEEAGYSVVIAMVILVSTVPVGMPVVTTTVLAVGAREMANEKAIVNRLSALEELSGIEILASDKTGTLTLNRLTLDKEDIHAAPGFSRDDVLALACLSARWEHGDAIDAAVTAAVGDREALAAFRVQRLIPFNPVDKRTTAFAQRLADGAALVTTKGAPQIIGQLLSDAAAKDAVHSYISERASRGLRSLGVAQSTDNEKTWVLVGLISLLDPPREDSAATIRKAQELGVEVKMVTGDQLAIGIETSKRLGLGTRFIEGSELMENNLPLAKLGARLVDTDGFAGVYPEHKHRIVQAMQARGMLVGMTGDGVNDAPALKAANVGIAVAGATPAAQGAADIVLTEEGISTIITAIMRSRKIFRRLETYIIYRIASSLILSAFFLFAIVCMSFEIPTWVLIVISICNDLSAMATSLDAVHTAPLPLMFSMTKCMAVALFMTAVSALSALLLLAFSSVREYLDWWSSWNINIQPDLSGRFITDGQTVACVYMGLTILIQLNIISTRNPSFWWHFSERTAPPPSLLLVGPVAAFLVAATFIAVYWPSRVKPDGGKGFMDGAGWAAIGVVWFYSLLWWNLADAAKVAVQKVFSARDVVVERAKHEQTPLPGWVRMLDAPERLGALAVKKMSLRKRKQSKADGAAEPEEGDAVAELHAADAASQRSHTLSRDSVESFRNLYRGRSVERIVV